MLLWLKEGSQRLTHGLRRRRDSRRTNHWQRGRVRQLSLMTLLLPNLEVQAKRQSLLLIIKLLHDVAIGSERLGIEAICLLPDDELARLVDLETILEILQLNLLRCIGLLVIMSAIHRRGVDMGEDAISLLWELLSKLALLWLLLLPKAEAWSEGASAWHRRRLELLTLSKLHLLTCYSSSFHLFRHMDVACAKALPKLASAWLALPLSRLVDSGTGASDNTLSESELLLLRLLTELLSKLLPELAHLRLGEGGRRLLLERLSKLALLWLLLLLRRGNRRAYSNQQKGLHFGSTNVIHTLARQALEEARDDDLVHKLVEELNDIVLVSRHFCLGVLESVV